MIDKVKDKSIHCGTIEGDAWYISMEIWLLFMYRKKG